jgi:hypothetical protein
MKIFKTKSLEVDTEDDDIDKEMYSVSFLSFERAIKESEQFNGLNRTIRGYRVTEQGIELILE